LHFRQLLFDYVQCHLHRFENTRRSIALPAKAFDLSLVEVDLGVDLVADLLNLGVHHRQPRS
jgi:hypothetical protein